jgi:hypothetical protein
MIYNGLALMMSAGPALFGVLYQLRHQVITGYHAALWADPLAAPRSRTERRHLRKPCGECSMIAELVVTRLV